MKRDWTNPWINPVGELLYPVLAFALRFVPKVYDSPRPEVYEEPELQLEYIRHCKDCGAYTTHQSLWWPLDQESTIECQDCGAVRVIG